jgi:hypothetical protein
MQRIVLMNLFLTFEGKMKKTALILTALLASIQPVVSFAKTPLTIPAEISSKMKKGKKLDLVWAAQDFDEKKGFKLGAVTNESDSDAQAALDLFPLELGPMVHPDSPYTLQVTITSFWMKPFSSDRPGAKIGVEGHVVDATGKTVAAFTASTSTTNGLTSEDCLRTAMRTIVFAMAKDLFTSAPLAGRGKAPAVIVPAAPAPVSTPADSAIIISAPAQVPPTPAPASPAAASTTPIPAPTPASVTVSISPSVPSLLPPAPAPAGPATVSATPVPTPAPASSTTSVPSSVPPQASPVPAPKSAAPAAVQPAPPAGLIPAAIAAKMQKGKSLAKVWISPAYDRSGGFSLGEVRYEVEARNDGVDQYLPGALAAICRADASSTLQLRVVQLQIRTQGQTGSMARLGVEGNIIAKDGSILVAFSTLESAVGSLDLTDTCRTASRSVVSAIAKELK